MKKKYHLFQIRLKKDAVEDVVEATIFKIETCQQWCKMEVFNGVTTRTMELYMPTRDSVSYRMWYHRENT